LIWASDRAVWRLSNLKRRAARAGVFNYRAVVWDGGPRPPTKTEFDGVLVDAPCSGIGTWQRNPHARWTSLNSHR
jgi:16S rRNA (cytosine967-C5)-methyltransferase